jgi:hypothetical protein
MGNKRRKGQCTDFYAGALKKIMLNKEGHSAAQLSIMLEAAKLLANLDGIPGLTSDSGQPSTPPIPGPDPLLESLKTRQAATVTDATS